MTETCYVGPGCCENEPLYSRFDTNLVTEKYLWTRSDNTAQSNSEFNKQLVA